MNPDKQVYVAVEPEVNPAMSTRPFRGGSSRPHLRAAVKIAHDSANSLH